MSRLAGFLFVIALAGFAAPAAAERGASCEWRSPARDPFRGDLTQAVDDYVDIPTAIRARLKARMEQVAFDEVVSIRRDRIEGNARYEPDLLDMHFGGGSICRTVTRKSWHADHEERALAYCEDGYCIAVPLVCHNVSRIVRRPAVATLGGHPTGGVPLVFEPPSAGLAPAPAPPGEPGPAERITTVAPPGGSHLPPLAGEAPAPPLPPVSDTPTTSTPGMPTDLPPGVVRPPDAPSPPLPPTGIPPLPPAQAVPEPTSWWLWMAGLAAGAAWRIRRRKPPA